MNSQLFAALLLKVSLVSFVKSQSYETSNSKNVVKFYVYISPIFSCWVTFYELWLLIVTRLWKTDHAYYHTRPIQFYCSS